MSRHIHAELMLQYAQDAMTTDKPWELWECRVPTRSIGKDIAPEWGDCISGPAWAVAYEYRRKPQVTPIQYSVSCAIPIKAVSPALAAQKFREAFIREEVIVKVKECDGLVHCYLPSGEFI